MAHKELILIRHGELPEEYAGRFVGSTDAPLGEAGIRSCRLLASLWKARYAGCAVFASPKLRTRMSAELICGDSLVRLDDRIREIDFGEWENLTFDEIAERDPERCREWLAHPDDVEFPGGEKFSDFCGRVEEFSSMVKSLDDERIAVVSHGGVLVRMICGFLGISRGDIWRWQPGRGSVSVIDFDPENLPGRFQYFNLVPEFLNFFQKTI